MTLRERLLVSKVMLVSLVSSLAGVEAADQKRPNILFIMADNHTTQAIGAYRGHLAPLNPTPNIVQWPKKMKQGSVNDWLINNADFAPTFLEVAGLKKSMGMQGVSLAAASRGKSKPSDWPEVTFYRYWMHLAHRLKVPAHFGVRSDRYKLIFFCGVTPEGRQPTQVAWEFYDLEKDPHEIKNGYDDPNYRGGIIRMKDQLVRVREELNETDTKYPAVRMVIKKHWDQ